MSGTKVLFLVFLMVFTLVILSVFSRGCDTVSRMADQTVYNADKHVWSYEEFHRKSNQYDQYKIQKKQAETSLDELQKRGEISGQNYDNLVTELTGVRQMMHRLAADYNAMSEIAYQVVWKSKGLPEKLE